MNDPVSDNPYASPLVDEMAGERAAFTPRTFPRDAVDCAIGAGFGLLAIPLATVLYGLPLLLANYYNFNPAPLLLFGLLMVSLVPLYSVRRIHLDDVGVRFDRILGHPRQLLWSEIASIAPASRREVIVQGYMWPPFPPRAPMNTMSYRGHWRIEYAGGVCYFPPRDEARFAAALAEFYRPAPSAGDG